MSKLTQRVVNPICRSKKSISLVLGIITQPLLIGYDPAGIKVLKLGHMAGQLHRI